MWLHYLTGLTNIYNGRLNQHHYINILENALLPTRDMFFADSNDWKFQQDNAPCHTAASVWFNENNITVPDWPARPPDLNPIENLWSVIDRKLTYYHFTTIDDLKAAMRAEWNKITTETCQKLFNSFLKRYQKVIDSKGRHIPY